MKKSLHCVFSALFLSVLMAACGGGGGGNSNGNAGSPQETINISGSWNFSNSGTVTITEGGQTYTQYPSGSGTIAIQQNGSSIQWVEPNFNEIRSGTIDGTNVAVSGKFVVAGPGVVVNKNIYQSSGTYSVTYSNGKKHERIEMYGTGDASGSDQGVGWSATGTDRLILTRDVDVRSTVSARTVQIGPTKNEGYKLQLIAEGIDISSGTVSGPGIGTLALGYPCPWRENCWIATYVFGSVKPNPGDNYVFQLKYKDGYSETTRDSTYALGVGFPTLLDPTNGKDVYTFSPTFSWTAPAWGCVSQYRLVVLRDSTGERVWNVVLPPNATSAKYNFNFGGGKLTAGEKYNWQLSSYDDCANQHEGYDNYTQVEESFRLSSQSVLLTGKAMVSVRINSRAEGYSLDFIANETSVVPITSATVAGPSISNLPLSKICWLEGCDWQTSQFFGQTKPTPGNEYTFTVTFSDGTTEVFKDTVSDLGVGFPVPILPANGATVPTQTPTFSWSPPSWGCVAWYHLIVNDNTGSAIWAPHLSSGSTSAVFNFDGKATMGLSSGSGYSWTISAFDDCANTNDGHDNFSSAAGGSFTVR